MRTIAQQGVGDVSRYQRWNALLDLLPGDGHLTVTEAAQALGV